MLIVSRRVDEAVLIRDGESVIKVVIAGVEGKQVKVGVEAPPQAEVLREELLKNKK